MSALSHVNPLQDPRWAALVQAHPLATVFHSTGWLQALAATYGYEPFVLTTTREGALENGLLACRVHTWMARRLVSLPFSDHCDPLVSTAAEATALCEGLSAEMARGRWRSLQVRPATVETSLPAAGAYAWHVLDLERSIDAIRQGMHPSHTRRAITRAAREGVTYESGTSDAQVHAFFALLRLTRRRHGVPPQPLAWFTTLARTLGSSMAVHIARKAGQAIAAIVTLRFKRTLVYKYGGSDARHHALGGMPFLFWRVIEQAHADGLATLDLGRSNLDQPGLIAFKEHLGAERRTLTYRQLPAIASSRVGGEGLGDAGDPNVLTRVARAALIRLPDPLFDLTGRMVYRHLG